MFHSIIIPHLGREDSLLRCVHSLWRGSYDVRYTEILVVGQRPAHQYDPTVRIIEADTSPTGLHLGPNEAKPFWKTHLLNVGIEQSDGEVLTFLDADAIVGSCFCYGASFLAASNLTKLCYRVRYRKPYSDYEECQLAHEAYGDPEADCSAGNPVHQLVFGNSQFSITRKILGDVRWDERYFGRSFEDMQMLRDIYETHGANYSAAIMTAEPYAMLHSRHPDSPGFEPGTRWERRNERRYHRRTRVWFVGDNHVGIELAMEGYRASHPECREELHQHPRSGGEPEKHDEWNDGLDKVFHIHRKECINGGP